MKIIINKSQIKYQTPKALLIKVPNTSSAFWISNKMATSSGKQVAIYLPENWQYRIFKNAKDVQEEDINYLRAAFENQIYEPKKTTPSVVRHTPNKIKPIKRDIENEFIR